MPAAPPFEPERGIEIDLAAGFPIDIDGADGFGAEDAGIEIAAGVWEKEDGVRRRMVMGEGGEEGEVRVVEMGVIFNAA